MGARQGKLGNEDDGALPRCHRGSQPLPPSTEFYISRLPIGIKNQGMLDIFGKYFEILKVTLLPAAEGEDSAAAILEVKKTDEVTNVADSIHEQVLDGLDEPIS